MEDLRTREILDFFEKRRGEIRRNRLKLPAVSLSMVEPTSVLATDLGTDLFAHRLSQIRASYGGALFISHTRTDAAFIKANVVPRLREQQVKYFFENSLTLGGAYAFVVGHALLACNVALVILSEKVLQSAWVPPEIDIIIARNMPAVFLSIDATAIDQIRPGTRKALRVQNFPLAVKRQQFFSMEGSSTILDLALTAVLNRKPGTGSTAFS